MPEQLTRRIRPARFWADTSASTCYFSSCRAITTRWIWLVPS
jgi:hypothetical protein